MESPGNFMVTSDGVKYNFDFLPHCNMINGLLEDFQDADSRFGDFPVNIHSKEFQYIVDYEKICMEEEKRIASKDKSDTNETTVFQELQNQKYPPCTNGEFQKEPEDLYKPINYDADDPYWKKRIPKRFHEYCKSIPMPKMSQIGMPEDDEIRSIYGEEFMKGNSDLYAIIWIGTYPSNISHEDFLQNWGAEFARKNKFLSSDSMVTFDDFKTKCKKVYSEYRSLIGGMKKFHEVFTERFGTRYPCRNHPEAPLPLVERIAYASIMVELDSLTNMLALMVGNELQRWNINAIKDSKAKFLEGVDAYYNELPTRQKTKEWLTRFDDKTVEEEISIRQANQWVYDLSIKDE